MGAIQVGCYFPIDFELINLCIEVWYIKVVKDYMCYFLQIGHLQILPPIDKCPCSKINAKIQKNNNNNYSLLH